MKLCQKCGAVQNDDRTTCVDCGALLGDSMTEGEEKAVNAELSETVTDLARKSDDFSLSKSDIVLGVLSIVFVAVLAVSILYIRIAAKSIEQASDPSNGMSAVIVGNSTVTESELLESVAGIPVIGIISFLFAALITLLPKLIWRLKTIGYGLTYEGRPAPSYVYIMLLKFTKYFVFAIGCLMLLLTAISII